MEEGGEGGQREGGGTAIATEGGGGKKGRGKSRGITLAKGSSCRKRPRTEKSDTETEAAGDEAWTIKLMFQEGAHDQHLSH